VVRDGVTPLLTAMLGDTVPLYSNLPVPLDAVPIAQWVIVDVPPVQAGNVIVAAGDTADAVTVHPPLVRATATRA